MIEVSASPAVPVGAPDPAPLFRGRDSGTVVVVTGPAGTDIGPVAAHLGADLGDGLAARTVVSGHGTGHSTGIAHTSPLAGWMRPAFTLGRPPMIGIMPGRISLFCVPSAWQNPDTNLGVAWTGDVESSLSVDLARLDHLGLHPGHRLTVQRRSGPYLSDHLVPAPVEFGDLAVHARDSVLRTGGKVLIEAGDGQTFLDALATVGLPPWAPYIAHLELWTVLDVSGLAVSGGGFDPAMVAGYVGAEIVRNGGRPDLTRTAVYVALTGVEALLPALAGVGNPDIDNHAATNDQVMQELGDLLNTVEDGCGAEVLLLGTGMHNDRYTYIDLLNDTIDPMNTTLED